MLIRAGTHCGVKYPFPVGQALFARPRQSGLRYVTAACRHLPYCGAGSALIVWQNCYTSMVMILSEGLAPITLNLAT